MTQTKAEFRKHFLEQRKRMQWSDIQTRSQRVADNFAELSRGLPDIQFWGGYRALPGEVNFDSEYQRQLDVGAPVAFPRMLDDETSIRFYTVSSLDSRGEWDLHPWGISQPKATQPTVDRSRLEGLIVPLLCCDRAGNRIGYGKGCYDRYLGGFDGWKVGIAFDWQLANDSVPTDEHDVPVDFLVLESDIIACSSRAMRIGDKFN